MDPVPDPSRSSVTDLLPHTGTARLLTDIVRNGSGFIEAIGRIPKTHPLVMAGRAPCFLGLELAAQAAAAIEALDRANETGDPVARIGHLARVRDAAFLRPELPVDTPLNVTAHLEGAAPPLAIYRIRVSVNGLEFLRGILSTHSGGR